MIVNHIDNNNQEFLLKKIHHKHVQELQQLLINMELNHHKINNVIFDN
jgi:hypothetical protein